MKTSVKWILGILIGLLIIGLVAVTGYYLLSQMTFASFHLGSRYDNPWDNYPGNRLPMPHEWGMRTFRTGWVIPFGFLASCLLCLGVITLIVVGVIALVRSQSRPKTTATQAPPASVITPGTIATPAPASEAEPVQACPSCQRPTQPDWAHCPYCGARLS